MLVLWRLIIGSTGSKCSNLRRILLLVKVGWQELDGRKPKDLWYAFKKVLRSVSRLPIQIYKITATPDNGLSFPLCRRRVSSLISLRNAFSIIHEVVRPELSVSHLDLNRRWRIKRLSRRFDEISIRFSTSRAIVVRIVRGKSVELKYFIRIYLLFFLLRI